MKTIGDGATGSDSPNCTYSRRKAEKQTRTKSDDSMIKTEKDELITQQMVDAFIQEVIQKAKTEYLRQCDNCHGNNDVMLRDSNKGKRRKDKENGNLVPQEKSSKKSNKDKPKHRHHYKYSDPVDEKDISQYENQDAVSLLERTPSEGTIASDTRKDSSARSGFYNRTVAIFRRLVGCCFGKT